MMAILRQTSIGKYLAAKKRKPKAAMTSGSILIKAKIVAGLIRMTCGVVCSCSMIRDLKSRFQLVEPAVGAFGFTNPYAEAKAAQFFKSAQAEISLVNLILFLLEADMYHFAGQAYRYTLSPDCRGSFQIANFAKQVIVKNE